MGGLTIKDFVTIGFVNQNHGFVLLSQHFYKENFKTNISPAQQDRIKGYVRILHQKD